MRRPAAGPCGALPPARCSIGPAITGSMLHRAGRLGWLSGGRDEWCWLKAAAVPPGRTGRGAATESRGGAALSFSMVQNDEAGAGLRAGDSARVTLRPLVAGDQDEFVALARASVGLHHPWYFMPTTREEFQAYLARFRQPGTEGFLVCVRDGGALAGIVTIDSIVRGRFQSRQPELCGLRSRGRARLLTRHAVHQRRLAGARAVGHHPRDDRLSPGRSAPDSARPLSGAGSGDDDEGRGGTAG